MANSSRFHWIRGHLRQPSNVNDDLSGALADTSISDQQIGRHLLQRRRPEKIYGRMGDLEVRLGQGRRDIIRAQRLRYQVFYQEMAATAGPITAMRRRDQDAYDAVCDHLLVVDHARDSSANDVWVSGRRASVVGTYRVLRQDRAERTLGFYTQEEYDIAPLMAAKSASHRFMELGRSCVLKPYRNKRTVELLWHGLWTYVREHNVDVMIGCASFPGTDPDAHALALSFLHHHARAPEAWRCRAHAHLYQSMDRISEDALDAKAALRQMPPLIKGYLRLGAFVGDGAVIDRQFGTTDVLIILPVENIDPRYFEHFGAPTESQSRLVRAN
ncbi:MAG: GNAT family N-acetyltransferase [Alphaproteobacteria bacterium]|nr:GNAT family N-acetyltransferase [Alphaproteobacteria bacterium]